jgi:hypothetical protein
MASRADRVRPTSAARLATRIGTPGGATGTSAIAIAAPRIATAPARRSRASVMSSATKNAGYSASRPSSRGSRLPPARAPTTVPPVHPTYWIALEPNSSQRSKVPSPRAGLRPRRVDDGLALGGALERPARQRRAQRGAHRQEARVHQRGGADRGGDRAARADDRDRGELRRAGEDDRRHDDRRQRRQARLLREDAERQRQQRAGHRVRRAGAHARAQPGVALGRRQRLGGRGRAPPSGVVSATVLTAQASQPGRP